jgi:superfamily II DNA/RNA helicase
VYARRCLFSATLDREVDVLVRRYMNDPSSTRSCRNQTVEEMRTAS